MLEHRDTLRMCPLNTYDGEAEGDAAVVFGIRSCARQVVARYRAAGKPFLIVDKGYTRRKSRGHIEINAYWRVGVNGLHSAVPAKTLYPEGRFEKLRMDVQPLIGEKGNGYVLILPPARKIFLFLDLGDLEYMKRFFAQVAKRVLDLTKRMVHFRGKTEQGRWQFTLEMSERVSLCSEEQTIRQSVAGAACVITHTTNAGVSALLAGVPVIELGCGVVKPLAEMDLDKVSNPRRYTEEERREFLNWLAYQQWTLAEIASGEAWAYLRPQLLR